MAWRAWSPCAIAFSALRKRANCVGTPRGLPAAPWHLSRSGCFYDFALAHPDSADRRRPGVGGGALERLSRSLGRTDRRADRFRPRIVAVDRQFPRGPPYLVRAADWALIPQFGIRFHLALDGLSLLLLMLTFFLGILSVLASWNEIIKAVGFFHLNLLWILAGIAGVFLAVNLFLLYFAWELMLVPMYFLISIWGHENRVYAAVKFFLFTQLSGLLMLIAILALF